MKKPKRLSRLSVYESDWINLFIDKVKLPSGKIIEKYHVLDYPSESVVALINNEKEEMLFIKSLRYITNSIDWELPAGGIEKGETINSAMFRELIEETGYQVNEMEHVYSFYPSNGMSNQIIHIVIGKAQKLITDKIDSDEVSEIEWKSISEVIDLIKNKKILDGVSLLAIFYKLIFNQNERK